MRMLDAPKPRSLNAAPPKLLRPPLVKPMDAHLDHHLASPRPKRLPRAGGAFLPGFAGLAEDFDETEVQVGYMDPGAAAMYHGGVGPMGAFDLQSLLTPRNMVIAGGVALISYFLIFKK